MTEDGKGEAPPDRWSTAGGILSGPRLIGAVGFSRLFGRMRAVGRVQSRHPKAPHYYLYALGVDPDHQGRGSAPPCSSGRCSAAATRSRDLRRTSPGLDAKSNARLYARGSRPRITEELTMARSAPTVSRG